MKNNLLKLILFLALLIQMNVMGNDNNTLVPKEHIKIVVPFTAMIYNMNVVSKSLNDQTNSYTYKLSDYLNYKKNGVIKTGFDSNWRISTVITELLCKSNLLTIGDSLDFIIHSPSKLFIDVDSLPTEYSFELHVDLTDSMAIEFELWPLFQSNNIEAIEFTKQIYSNHFNFYYKPKEHLEILENSFKQSLLKEDSCAQGELCAIDFVPWLEAQDGEHGKIISSKVVSKTSNSTIIKLEYEFVINNSKTIIQSSNIVLKNTEDGKWLMTDLIMMSGQSLKKMIDDWFIKFSK